MKQKRLLSWPSLAAFKADTSVEQQANDTVRIDGLLKTGTTWIAVPAAGETPDDQYLLQKDNDPALTWWASAVSRILASDVALSLMDILDNTETIETVSVPGAVPGGAYVLGVTSDTQGLLVSPMQCVAPDELAIRVKNSTGALVPATTLTLNVYTMAPTAAALAPPDPYLTFTGPFVEPIVAALVRVRVTLHRTQYNNVNVTGSFWTWQGVTIEDSEIPTGQLITDKVGYDWNTYASFDWGEDVYGNPVTAQLNKVGASWIIQFSTIANPNFAFYRNASVTFKDPSDVLHNYTELTDPATNEVFYVEYVMDAEGFVTKQLVTIPADWVQTYRNVPVFDYYSNDGDAAILVNIPMDKYKAISAQNGDWTIHLV